MHSRARSLTCLLATTLLLVGACDKKPEDKKAADKKVEKKTDDKAADKKAEVVPEPQPQPKVAEPVPATGDVLALGVVKIMEKDKPDQAIELAADGTLTMSPSEADDEKAEPKILKITADGKISSEDGTLVAQVDAAGILSFDGKPSGVVLSDTGMAMVGPDDKTGTATFNEDGSITVVPEPAEDLVMVHEGCTGPMVKTCGAILTVLLFTAGEATAGEGEGAEPKVVEAKAVEAEPVEK